VIAEIEERAEAAGRGAAGREFSLAKTAAEEAVMRYTRGRAFELGRQSNYDFDKPAA
jgi:hypothetical protein